MLHPAWIFAAAITAAGLGIWLLLAPNPPRLKQLGAALAAAGAILVATQMPRMESLYADLEFMLLATFLLMTVVATVVSRRAIQSAAYYFAALAIVSDLLLLPDGDLLALATVAASFALVPGGFMLLFERQTIRQATARLAVLLRKKEADGNTDHKTTTKQRSPEDPEEMTWEPLLCATSGMALTGTLIVVIHTAFAGSDVADTEAAARTQNHMTLAAMLLGIGLIGFLNRRNLIAMLLSAEIMLLGAMLAFTVGQTSLGRGSLIIVALAAVGQPVIALASLYLASRGMEDPTEAASIQGETVRGEVLAMVAGLLILTGVLMA